MILCHAHLILHYVLNIYPHNKVHEANIRPTWILSAPGGPHVGPMNLVIRVSNNLFHRYFLLLPYTCITHRLNVGGLGKWTISFADVEMWQVPSDNIFQNCCFLQYQITRISVWEVRQDRYGERRSSHLGPMS